MDPITSSTGAEIDSEVLVGQLYQVLPWYIVPSGYHEHLPRNQTGKVERSALTRSVTSLQRSSTLQ